MKQKRLADKQLGQFHISPEFALVILPNNDRNLSGLIVAVNGWGRGLGGGGRERGKRESKGGMEGRRVGNGGQRLTDIHTEATEAGSEKKTFPPFLLPDALSDVEKDNIWGKGHTVHPTEILLLLIGALHWF